MGKPAEDGDVSDTESLPRRHRLRKRSMISDAFVSRGSDSSAKRPRRSREEERGSRQSLLQPPAVATSRLSHWGSRNGTEPEASTSSGGRAYTATTQWTVVDISSGLSRPPSHDEEPQTSPPQEAGGENYPAEAGASHHAEEDASYRPEEDSGYQVSYQAEQGDGYQAEEGDGYQAEEWDDYQAEGDGYQAEEGDDYQAEEGDDYQAEEGYDYQAEEGYDYQAEEGYDYQGEEGYDYQAEEGDGYQAEEGDGYQPSYQAEEGGSSCQNCFRNYCTQPFQPKNWQFRHISYKKRAQLKDQLRTLTGVCWTLYCSGDVSEEDKPKVEKILNKLEEVGLSPGIPAYLKKTALSLIRLRRSHHHTWRELVEAEKDMAFKTRQYESWRYIPPNIEWTSCLEKELDRTSSTPLHPGPSQ